MPVPPAPIDGDAMRALESTYHARLRLLTPKQQVLIHQYLIDGNGSRAATKAGYSARSAPELASQTFKNLKVAAAVQAGLAMLAARAGITAEKVIREIAAVAFASAYSFAETEDGFGVADGAMPDAGVALQVRYRQVKKADGGIERETTYVQQDKLKALELLGKKLKLFVERAEIENAQDEAYKLLLREIRARPGGRMT